MLVQPDSVRYICCVYNNQSNPWRDPHQSTRHSILLNYQSRVVVKTKMPRRQSASYIVRFHFLHQPDFVLPKAQMPPRSLASVSPSIGALRQPNRVLGTVCAITEHRRVLRLVPRSNADDSPNLKIPSRSADFNPPMPVPLVVLVRNTDI